MTSGCSFFQIICISGAISTREKDPIVNGGDVPFVLMIYSNTKITVIEDSISDDESDNDSVQAFFKFTSILIYLYINC